MSATETPLLEKLQSELQQTQSCSGSEADLQSSNEQLNTSLEKNNLRTTPRVANNRGIGIKPSMAKRNNETQQRVYNLFNNTKNFVTKSYGSNNSNFNLNAEQYAHLSQISGQLLEHEMLRKLLELPPPPAYTCKQTFEQESRMHIFRRSIDKARRSLSQSRSQPDLRIYGQEAEERALAMAQLSERLARPPAAQVEEYEAIAARATQMVELLSEENKALRDELESYYKKVSKLQKLEVEIQKIHQAHDSLCKSSEKRERLEKSARIKLETEIKNLRERNAELKEQLSAATAQYKHDTFSGTGSSDSEMKRELNKRDVMIGQLLSQNKEIQDTKDRQEIELAAQRATLSEQRTHIDILDNALTNAQASVVKLEEECRKKQLYVDRVDQLQKALASLQLASGKREQSEKKLRQRLEAQIEELKYCREKKDQSQGTEILTDIDESSNLRKSLSDRDERIMTLENELMKWEQKYVEESAMRQLTIDAATVPKDAKIAALEKTSQETEKLIAEARTEKLRHMDDIYTLQKKCADLEAKVQMYQAHLTEKEAMITVLQRHSAEKDAAYSAILRSPRHSPHPSFLSSASQEPSYNNSTLTRSKDYADKLCGAYSSISVSSADKSTSSLASNARSDTSTADHEGSQDSIISALQREKKAYPSHYWQV